LDIRLLQSPDSCQTWYQINDVLENSGEYLWDTSTVPDGIYVLKVEATDNDGNSGWGLSGLVGVDNSPSGVVEEPTPIVFSLQPSSPNPFGAGTNVRFSLPRKMDVGIAIYDLSGRLVTRLVKGEQPAGHHSVHWNGTDARGHRVAAGVYFCRLTASGYSAVSKMIRLQ
jgi:hypothetical protein